MLNQIATTIAVCVSLIFRAALAGVLGWVLIVSLVPLGAVPFVTPLAGAAAFAVLGLIVSGLIEVRSGFRRKPGIRPFSFATVALTLAFTAFVGWTIADHHSDREVDAAAAREAFDVHPYSAATDDDRLTQTLAEFERSRQELAALWGATPEQVARIHLRLFASRAEFRSVTRQPPLTLGITSCSGNQPTIGMPATMHLQTLLTEGSTVSTTPRHELVHAILCVMLSEEAFHAIPRWYHEGIAQAQQHSGFGGWPERLMTMSRVSLDSGALPDAETFCAGNRHADLWFYRASWAFVRWLEFNHGEDAVRRLAFASSTPEGFGEAFAALVGSTCKEAYVEWRAKL